MPSFEITVKIKCTAEAQSKEALATDLARKEKKKDDLAKIVQAWLNEPPKEET